MIEFNDSFSQTAVEETMCTHPARARLRSHIEALITLELTEKFDTQLTSLLKTGELDLNSWNGVNSPAAHRHNNAAGI